MFVNASWQRLTQELESLYIPLIRCSNWSVTLTQHVATQAVPTTLASESVDTRKNDNVRTTVTIHKPRIRPPRRPTALRAYPKPKPSINRHFTHAHSHGDIGTTRGHSSSPAPVIPERDKSRDETYTAALAWERESGWVMCAGGRGIN